jgi:RNase P/RNase MRP subunit p29
MNLIGERIRVLSSTDPTKTGRTGRVLLETAKTLVIDSGVRTLRIEKSGSAILVIDSGEVLTGSDMAGRLEDRWGRRAP